MKFLQSPIIKLFWFCVGLYGAGITFYTLLQLTVGEQIIFVAWMNNWAYLLWAVAIVLIIPCIIFRRFRLICLFILPTVVLTVNYLPLYFPRTVTPLGDSQLLTVLTYNINISPTDMNKIADDIRRVDADVVAIQELTLDAAAEIEAQLSEQYPYRALHPVDGTYGQGVLSKYPILHNEYWKVHLGHQRVSLAVNGQEIAFYNVHPVHHSLPFWGSDIRPRTREVNAFMEKATADDLPIIIAGDMNMTDQSADYQRIAHIYKDSYREVGYGMGATFPAHIPYLPSLMRIDYVFHDDNFIAVQADVSWSSGGSDHRPLFVELALLDAE